MCRLRSVRKHAVYKYACALLVYISLTLSAHAAPTQWVCMPELSNGFKFNTALKEWRPVEFKSSMTYIITKEEKMNRFIVKELGESDIYMLCDELTNNMLFCTNNVITSVGLYEMLVFNKDTLRFFATYSGSWMLADENTSLQFDTPYIQIGKCSPL